MIIRKKYSMSLRKKPHTTEYLYLALHNLLHVIPTSVTQNLRFPVTEVSKTPLFFRMRFSDFVDF